MKTDITTLNNIADLIAKTVTKTVISLLESNIFNKPQQPSIYLRPAMDMPTEMTSRDLFRFIVNSEVLHKAKSENRAPNGEDFSQQYRAYYETLNQTEKINLDSELQKLIKNKTLNKSSSMLDAIAHLGLLEKTYSIALDLAQSPEIKELKSRSDIYSKFAKNKESNSMKASTTFQTIKI